MKLVVTENITADGVIDLAGGWFQPEGGDPSADTADIEEVTRGHMKRDSGLLLGRVTFESFRGYWPLQTDDTTGVTEHLNAVPKYVVSSTLGEPGWENTTVLRGDVISEVRTLKDAPGDDLGVTGSITLVHALIGAGLVDEYRLFQYPVVIGSGRRMFADGGESRKLELVETTPFQSGVVLLIYRPA